MNLVANSIAGVFFRSWASTAVGHGPGIPIKLALLGYFAYLLGASNKIGTGSRHYP